METSIRELRSSMKQIFDAVKHGEEITVCSHNRPIAKIIPFNTSAKKDEDKNAIFGMWKDYENTKDVVSFSRRLRKGRKKRDI